MDKTDKRWIVSGKNFKFYLDPKTGLIEKALVGGTTVITGGPHLMILPVDNNKVKVKDNIPTIQKASAFNAAAFLSGTCSNWVCGSSVVEKQSSDELRIRVTGSYDQAAGDFLYTFFGDGRFYVDYYFKVKKAVNPRQLGMVFDLNGKCDTLKWKRKGIWSVYPDDHIGRLEGTAKAFYNDGRFDAYGPRTEPAHSWSHDATYSGSNDFRSTKHNVYSASVFADDNTGLGLVSDGRHHVRCWVDGDSTRMLVANFSCGGGEHYLSFHAKQGHSPLKPSSLYQYQTTISGALSYSLLQP